MISNVGLGKAYTKVNPKGSVAEELELGEDRPYCVASIGNSEPAEETFRDISLFE